ncbi:MAG TPA: pirin family protein [Pyrinomonadaceae bacterium]|jgi:redox-sensitive bicupin YhaK (pirin superfamily)|nr:pirin family protein [Pyrinomonadaceae bacterium]
MTNKRNVATVITPENTSDGAGVKLKRSIATRTLSYLDPFLLFDHFGSENPDDYIAGFPIHPHRGIETVTYMLAGAVEHKDSSGNKGIIRTGDVQWMTAGGGIMHEEMPIVQDGRMEGFQLWVNLPAKLKMSKPRYQEVASASIPEYHGENGVNIRVIAGKVGDVDGAVSEIAADPTYLDVRIPAGAVLKHAIPQGHTAFAYLFEGSAKFDENTSVEASKLVIFADGDEIEVTAGAERARFLLVSGKPLGEPVARYGPFVMNTEEEIEQALMDLKKGTFIQK